MSTIFGLIQRTIQSALTAAAIAAALVAFIFVSLNVQKTNKTAEDLILNESVSLSQAGTLLQDVFMVERELHRFIDALQSAQTINIQVEIILNGKLMAACGSNEGFNWFTDYIVRNQILPSGQTLEIRARINHTKSILSALFFLTLIESLILVIFVVLNAQIKKSLLNVTTPLQKSIERVDFVASNLDKVEALKQTSDALPDLFEIHKLDGSIQILLSEIITLKKELVETSIARGRAELAVQVAHDIRSPLAALNVVLTQASLIDEGLRVHVKSAITRIRDIANNLLDQNRDQHVKFLAPTLDQPSLSLTHSLRPELFSAIIESAVSEVRYQFSENQNVVITEIIEDEASFEFAIVNATEVSRIISNLVKNSVEAMQGTGSIEVRLRTDGNQITLSITDDGKGIPPEMLDKVIQRGGTYGKSGGNGFGLSHARATVLSWGGSFEISSKLGKGTKVLLSLSKAEPPSWFAKHIAIGESRSVVVLDDDPGIHSIWSQRLSDLTPSDQIELLHFQKSDELLNWYRENIGAADDVTYLCDFELLGSKLDGLSLIETLGISDQAILVTNRAGEHEIQEKCEKRGIKIVPKTLASRIPILVN